MSKENLLDRLAGAMKTLGKREGKALTPRQRVAAAQRFNELGSIGQSELASMAMDDPRYPEIHRRLNKMGLINNEEELQDNPFLSDNLDKYEEQSDFLDWCRYNRLEPNGRNLKTFRWERYKGMSVPQRESIYYNYDNHFLPEERMWYGRSDMPDYLPVGWDKSSNWRY